MLRGRGALLTGPLCGLLLLLTLALGTGAAAATVVNPVAEAKNLLVSQERQAEYDTPSELAAVAQATAQYQQARVKALAADPGRQPNPNPCTLVASCPVDPALTKFTAEGGISDPVLFTARSGATLSGHLWATKAGPAKRPAIVIINGSIVGYEQAYWYAAQALARDGFVVLTFDAQGEGMSDQFGAAPDQMEGAFAGTPVLGPQLGGSGLPFYDGGEDALDFLLSTPQQPYEPVPSRTSGTSHAGKQNQRVAAGFDAGYDPLYSMIDRSEIGIAGHSYGAEAASWIGQSDPRVKAVVAWDNLCQPTAPSPTEAVAIATAPINVNALGLFGLPEECFGSPSSTAPALTKPALGISADYLLTPEPYTVTPDPRAKEAASLAYSKAGVDSGEIVLRGGTHLDFTDLPTGAIPASRRGIDMITWYTDAWFDKYLKHDPSADAQLLTTRWQDDPETGKVDPSGDVDAFSYHYDSRLDIHLAGGGTFDCEDLAAGCSAQVPASTDCGPSNFTFALVDTGQVPADTCDVKPATTPAPARRSKPAPARRSKPAPARRKHRG